MAATIIDGKKTAAEMRSQIRSGVEEIKAKHGIVPCLAVILVGNNPASLSYVTAKEKACAEAGITSFDNRLPDDTTEEALIALIKKLNLDSRVHGILVQLPLPKHIDENNVIDAISPEKDVDGFTPANVGKMVIGQRAFQPCTPHGVIKLLEVSGIRTDGAHVVVIGRSNIVGKPLMNMLVQKSKTGNATVTLCHTHTKELSKYTLQADIIVAASGHPNTLTADMIKEGAVVIDVGVNRVPSADSPKGYRLVGDTDFNALKEKASFITPVPGGVGPMTITMLLFNTLEAARNTIKD